MSTIVEKYRKKPVVIEAMGPIRPSTCPVVATWCGGLVTDSGLAIPTLEGIMNADFGDYVIKGVAGEFYPCKPEIFEATYEWVDEE